MTPLFHEAPVLSPRSSLVCTALGPLFAATSEASLSYRTEVEVALASGDAPVDLTYGEIDLEGFLALLDSVTAAIGEEISEIRSFVELGCGMGKSMLVAAAFFPALASCTGYEICPQLCAMGEDILQKYWPAVADGLPLPSPPPTITILLQVPLVAFSPSCSSLFARFSCWCLQSCP